MIVNILFSLFSSLSHCWQSYFGLNICVVFCTNNHAPRRYFQGEYF